ncbi:poly-gamma-glutamate synthesis protein (capsule biosynthesis protein) [Thermomonospora echinospora]|uniref:Poly-gamma-glutamate synthesis protein (Capsule biosynthesis protein) n=1 Tax=Thermomonospora echinospora TaxID=1992 RepID=A0A1H6E286_9ACTN|nr:CapA family protein [Thermomonospora echinospora]SEG91273.1 poly-gamma-glutamate synthesis protein (capsule biosynthesis protein) [Thermomonospora echinospora]
MPITLALAGDTMLGRDVARRLSAVSSRDLFSTAVRNRFTAADLAIVNLECCISTRGEPWRSPGKMFHFRAPPKAAESLSWLGVDCVTLANNHALDYGFEALADTLDHLENAGIEAVGAGLDVEQARAGVILEARGMRVGVLGITDHPADFAAGPHRPGVAYADLGSGVPGWVTERIADLHRRADAVVVTPHWGPNMIAEPLPYVRRAAERFVDAGATLVAGHSAHIFHGVAGPILYDLGDFIDDYAVDDRLRNDLGLLWLVTLDSRGPLEVTAVPLALDYCRTRQAGGNERSWIRDRLTRASAEFGTPVEEHDGVFTLRVAVPAR